MFQQLISAQSLTHIFVGSTNPVKISAVKTAILAVWPEVKVQGLNVESGVSAQPKSDQETRDGADQRAKAALLQGLSQLPPSDQPVLALGVGLEGGVFQPENLPTELWSTVWVSLATNLKDSSINSELVRANGARFKIPEPIATSILAGQEMGEVVGSLTNNPNLKREGGMIGLITAGFVDRTIEYTALFKLALGLWYGQDWYQKLAKANIQKGNHV